MNFRPPNAFQSYDPQPSVRDLCAHCMAGFEFGQKIVTRVVPWDDLPEDEPLRFEHLHESCAVVECAVSQRERVAA